ncbi:MAG: hypothetical protein BRD48_07730 [Bacteroidetes bacterium QS_9_68_14]|nr:MAG: hypothetical protein BRD48_07730 [Bacteroidetes bacterium QS_9_68_14]
MSALLLPASRHVAGLLGLLLLVASARPVGAQQASAGAKGEPGEPTAPAQPFLPDDPVDVDPDRLDMPAPRAIEPSGAGDYFENTFGSPGEYEGPARNVNTMQEVPASSWYNWRHYHERMSIPELKRGPNPPGKAGPAPGPWTVVSTKEEGKSIGMQIEDARGDRYLLKFDPSRHVELATGAEVVVTKLFHALGYNVPQNYAVSFRPERLELGEEVSLGRDDLRELLGKAAQYPDGHIRALASQFLEGEPIGPFQYHGTRPDDGNDIFPHESRRELRGMRVFAAWLNHVDARSINSFDSVVNDISPTTGDSAQYVRHHLIDFGSTLGGSPLGPLDRWQGYEYSIQPGRMALRAVSLGFAGTPWLSIDYPDYPSVGHIEAEHFDPTAWKPLYPNPAFQRMDRADAFWAARQVAHFTDEELRAIVATGKYSNAEAESYLAETLMKRRDKIARAYLDYGGGLDRFRVEDGPSEGQRLAFDDLLAGRGLAPEARERRVTWRVFDNEAGEAGRTLARQTTARESLALPGGAMPPFLLAEIETLAEGARATTYAYLRHLEEEGGYEMVGLERTGEVPIRKATAPAAASASGKPRDGEKR